MVSLIVLDYFVFVCVILCLSLVLYGWVVNTSACDVLMALILLTYSLTCFTCTHTQHTELYVYRIGTQILGISCGLGMRTLE